jgi:hypothetical protein
MFGDFFGKVASAPLRILDLPFKIIDSLSDMPPEDTIGLDAAAKTVEKSVKEIFDKE